MSDRAKDRIIAGVTRAFLERGYDALSMSAIAEWCGLTRRGLYHHFSSKEELLRAMIRRNNALAILRGDEASRTALASGLPPLDVIAAWMDERFGTTRRNIGDSSHGQELNDVAFRLATDIMIEVSYESNRKLADLVTELCHRGQLQLRPGYTPERIGRLLGDGARGVNQARPPFPNSEIAARYREIVEAMLFGFSAPVPVQVQTAEPRRSTTSQLKPAARSAPLEVAAGKRHPRKSARADQNTVKSPAKRFSEPPSPRK